MRTNRTLGIQVEKEDVVKAMRRRITREDWHCVIDEADRCTGPGASAALLRREGMHSTRLETSRMVPRRREPAVLAAGERGPKPDPREDRVAE